MSKFAKLNKVSPQSPSPAPLAGIEQEPENAVVEQKTTTTPVEKKTNSNIAAKQPSSTASMQPSSQTTVNANEIALLVVALRQGTSTNTSYRTSKTEEQNLAVMLSDIKMRHFVEEKPWQQKVTKNELVRIAIHMLTNDYKERGDNCKAIQVLKGLYGE